MPYIGKKPENIIATAIDSTTGDFSGNVTAGGTLGVTGAVTANAGVVVDEMTIDGDTLTAPLNVPVVESTAVAIIFSGFFPMYGILCNLHITHCH